MKINYQEKIKKYYQKHHQKKPIIIIIPDKIIKKHIFMIKKQIIDVINCNIKTIIITNSKNMKKIKELEKTIQQNIINCLDLKIENELINKSFEIANKKGISSIFYFQTKPLKTKDWIKMNNINLKTLSKHNITKKLETTLKNILNNIKQKDNNIRFHIINTLINKSLYKELFTINWAWNWNWVLLSDNFIVSFSPLDKLNKYTIIFLEIFLKQNKKYLKKRSLDYILSKKNNFIVWSIDKIPVWMFEIIDLWNNVIEIWAFNINNNLQWLWIWSNFINYIINIKKNKFENNKIIFITSNKILSSLLEKKWLSKVEIGQINNPSIKNRYKEMIDNTKEDNKNRVMYLI